MILKWFLLFISELSFCICKKHRQRLLVNSRALDGIINLLQEEDGCWEIVWFLMGFLWFTLFMCIRRHSKPSEPGCGQSWDCSQEIPFVPDQSVHSASEKTEEDGFYFSTLFGDGRTAFSLWKIHHTGDWWEMRRLSFARLSIVNSRAPGSASQAPRPASYIGSWDLNSEPQACTVSTWLLSCLPSSSLLF
jgi:hypothetical protein